MKTKLDPRHQYRVHLLELLFAWEFRKKSSVSQDLKNIVKNIAKIDKIICGAAPQWPIEKMAKVDLSILRLAVFELLWQKSEPYRVVIDEAVELAKSYGGEQSSAFVNGALGTIYAKQQKQNATGF